MNNQEYVFKYISISISEPHKPKTIYPCIVMADRETGLVVDIPRLERWYIPWREEEKSYQTLRIKAEAICALLNFILQETEVRTLNEITITILRQFYLAYKMKKNGEARDPAGWGKGIAIVAGFLTNYYEKNVGSFVWGYCPEDILRAETFTDKKGRLHTRLAVNRLGIKAPAKTHRKNRYLVKEYLKLFVETLKKHDPMIVAAVALQAYAGLREGEPVNLTWGRIKREISGFGRVSKIQLQLLLEADYARNSDARTEFGRIKKSRVQEVYPDFNDIVVEVLEGHELLLRSRHLPTDSESPLFYNKWGKPMTVNCLQGRIKKDFNEYFLPSLISVCQAEGTWADNAPFIEAYEKEYPGAHMFRHWFTMYLLTQAKLSREEIAHWRGDEDSSSLEDYIHCNQEMLELYRESAFQFQKWMVGEIV